MAEGKNPVRTITAKDFSKEVLNERDPVVVIFYKEGDNRDIQFIRKAQAAFHNRSKVVAMSMEDDGVLMSKFFGDSIATQSASMFVRGKFMGTVFQDPFKEQDVIERTIPYLDYYKNSLQTPIPILGPLIDLIRRSRLPAPHSK